MSGQPFIVAYFVRHGLTELNEKNVYRGTNNVPLSKEGYQDAHEIAQYLSNMDFCHCFCSDRKRSEETARIICEKNHCNLKVVPNKGLGPWNIGYLAGKPKDEHRDEMQHYVDHPNEIIPQGESLSQFRERVRPLFKETVDIALGNGCPVLIVCHSSIIHDLGESINGDASSALVEPGGCTALFIQNGELHAEAVFKPDHKKSDRSPS
jgi:alpha-ribazole phosphatase